MNNKTQIPQHVLTLDGTLHIAVEYRKYSNEATLYCIENFPKSNFSALYPWHRAFIPSVNLTVQEKKRCAICFPTELTNDNRRQ